MSAGAGAPSRSFVADRRAWLAVLVILAGTVLIARGWRERRAMSDPVDGTPPAVSDWRLATLAFPRTDGAALAAWFEALRSAGFHPVTIEQVEAALAGRAQLPARSLLLTFDDSRVETFEAADPLLRRFGWTAVMFLDAVPQHARDTHHVSWHRLERMIESGAWRLGAKGESGRAEIESNVPGARVAAIALVDDPFGVTGARESGATPAVFRLAVRPEWSALELVTRLESAIVPPALDVPAPAVMRAGMGSVEFHGGEVTLEHPTRAEVWLPGLRFVDDWTLEARVRLDQGQIWIVQEGASGRTHWRTGLDGRAIYTQEVDASGALRQLARRARKPSNERWGRLRVVKRGPGLIAFWNGAPLAETAVKLSFREAGRVAVVAASDGEGARAAVAGVVVTPLSSRIALASPNPAAGEVRRLVAAATTTSGLSPRWIEVGPGGLHESPLNRNLFAMIAHRHAWDLLPEVVVRDAAVAARPEVAAEVARRAFVAGFDGVCLEFAGSPEPGARDALERALVARDLRVVVAS